ncbi:MAG: endolytic transglycosylase MltG [Oscillospiraceae bacterium]|jgi:UPF0755 protein|nr:endolytic transglycosylase MltG [Oscillospiraceae bacterium]
MSARKKRRYPNSAPYDKDIGVPKTPENPPSEEFQSYYPGSAGKEATFIDGGDFAEEVRQRQADAPPQGKKAFQVKIQDEEYASTPDAAADRTAASWDVGAVRNKINDRSQGGKAFKVKIQDEEYLNIPDADPGAYDSGREGDLFDSAAGYEASPEYEDAEYSQPYYGNEYDDLAPKPKKKKRKKRNIFGGVVFTCCVLAVSILLSVFILRSMQDFLGIFKNNRPVDVEIPENPTNAIIAEILRENNIISNKATFLLYAKLKVEEEDFVAGSFLLNENMSYDELFSVLQNEYISSETATITIIEGSTIRTIANQLEEAGICSADDLMQALDDWIPKFSWEKDIPSNPDRYFKYEGYLFPNTHEMYVGETPSSVINRLFKDFDSKITSDVKEQCEKQGMTLDELVTLASLIQREASGHEDEMIKVSAVFRNRLNNPEMYPKLQSDTTRAYIRNNIENFVRTSAELRRYENAYDTYICDGLPAGPVCNPSQEAIMAALYPSEDESMKNVYFFVTDINGNFYYASTFDEHMYNVAVATNVHNEEGKYSTGGLATDRD